MSLPRMSHASLATNQGSPASSVRARNDAPLNSNHWISLFIWSLLVFDGFDAGDEEVDAGGAFVPPVGVEVFDVHGFAFLVGEV